MTKTQILLYLIIACIAYYINQISPFVVSAKTHIQHEFKWNDIITNKIINIQGKGKLPIYSNIQHFKWKLKYISYNIL